MKIISQRKRYTSEIKNVLLANNCRKLLIRIGIYLIFLSIAVLIALIPNIVKNEDSAEPKRARYNTDMKYILFWKHQKRNKRSFYKELDYLPGQSQFIDQNCPYINCYITYNKSLLRTEEDYDAIVFNVHDVKKLNAFNMNLGRSPDQIYIFKSHESSEHHPICNSLYDDFFNWTWTYRLDSDIPHPFINIHDDKNYLFGPAKSLKWITNMEHTTEYDSKVESKTKAIAWLVTNCKLKKMHHDFVKDLKEELKGYNYTIDTFGPCTERKCAKGGIAKCLKNIEKEYFFTLVLEDSVAKDYVTEKMVKGMTYLSVPILNGQADYDNFLPPASYINTRSFNIKKMGAVIDYLIKNPTKYSYFFDWKKYYSYTTRPRNYLCDLCTKLNEHNKTRKSYKELRRWWNPDFEDYCGRAQMYTMFIETP